MGTELPTANLSISSKFRGSRNSVRGHHTANLNPIDLNAIFHEMDVTSAADTEENYMGKDDVNFAEKASIDEVIGVVAEVLDVASVILRFVFV